VQENRRELYLQWETSSKSYNIIIYRTAPYSVTLNDLSPISTLHYYLMLNISEMVRDTDIVSTEYLHTHYSTVSFRMTSSDFVKY